MYGVRKSVHRYQWDSVSRLPPAFAEVVHGDGLDVRGEERHFSFTDSRHIGVTHKTTWYLCHRIRKAMEELNAEPLGGTGKVVEVDETYLGGRITRKGVGAAKETKVAILGIAERSGRVHLQKISNAKAETIKPILKEKLNPETKQVVTDGAPVYGWVVPSIVPVSQHKVVIHKDEIEEFGEVSSKTIEGAFSLFKRGVSAVTTS